MSAFDSFFNTSMVKKQPKVKQAAKVIGRDTFKGKNVVFTGTLSAMKRDDAKAKVVTCGGHVASVVSSTTDFLVMGNDAFGTTKETKAREKGITVLSEKEFLEIVN